MTEGARSVDQEAVAKERERMANILQRFAPEDIFNFDETGLCGFAPPDRGLATKQLSGKKSSKFRITLGFMCNSTGLEKLPIMYIGKYKRPRCFPKGGPTAQGFYYRNNKTAWMTSLLFEEYIKTADLRFQRQNRHVCLLIDNFSGHSISCQPKNIELEYFEPNMTSFIQPLDAGIIRCFKAHYRKHFCLRAIEQDELGEPDIYKLNLHEVMLLAEDAWPGAAVTPETVHNCWRHAIPAVEALPVTPAATLDATAWAIMKDFASGTITSMPHALERLQAHLGDRYVYDQWKPAFDAVFEAEEDVVAAVHAVDTLKKSATSNRQTGREPPTTPHVPQLEALENELLHSVEDLCKRKRIHGTRPTLQDLLNPVEEQEIGATQFSFPGGDDEIISSARQLDHPAAQSEDEDSDDEEPIPPTITPKDAVDMCEKLEQVCILYSGAEGMAALKLQQQLRALRRHLKTQEILSMKQRQLTDFWGGKHV